MGELLGWEECAENMSFRVDKAWRQRCSQRFRNILDMIAKKADHSVLRLLQISQQHIESQLERVKHERELWKEVVERRQQQPLQLALSMKEHPSDAGFGSSPGKRALTQRWIVAEDEHHGPNFSGRIPCCLPCLSSLICPFRPCLYVALLAWSRHFKPLTVILLTATMNHSLK